MTTKSKKNQSLIQRALAVIKAVTVPLFSPELDALADMDGLHRALMQMGDALTDQVGHASVARSAARKALDDRNNFSIDAGLAALMAARLAHEAGWAVAQSPIDGSAGTSLLTVAHDGTLTWRAVVQRDLVHQFGGWCPVGASVKDEGLSDSGRAQLIDWFRHGAVIN